MIKVSGKERQKLGSKRTRGCRIMVITSASQAEEGGPIPLTRSQK